MRFLYFDCFAGIGGDMIAGALLDMGVDLGQVQSGLRSLNLSGFDIAVDRVTRASISASKFDVKVTERQHAHRHLGQITELIQKSAISPEARDLAIRIFERLGDAEAKAHGISIDKVHFHEVGAVDSIVDVVTAAIGLTSLGAAKVFSSPVRVGSGQVKTEHGLLSIPAPGTAALLQGVPVFGGESEGEFATPTGVAILTTICQTFGPMPAMTIDQIGYGAGTWDPKAFPNLLRIMAGEDSTTGESEPAGGVTPEKIVVIETNIDDMNPQAYGYVFQRAFALGALDAFITPVQMKKDRPGAMLTLLAPPARLEPLCEMLLRETTTLGVRFHEAARRVLARAEEIVDTPYGPVRVKVARQGGNTLHFQAEYDDCARLAASSGAPILEVMAAANAAYRDKLPR